MGQESKDGSRQKKKDIFRVPERLEHILRFVPNAPELAHRYIASRIQCSAADAGCWLEVTMVRARDLRNADWLDGTLSDPYCICKIPGKPHSAIRTHVIDDNLNPEWNHKGIMKHYVAGDSLLFEVFDKDLGSTVGIMSDDFLGRAKLTSASFYPKGFSGDLRLEEAGAGRNAFLTVNIKVLTPGEESTESKSGAPMHSIMGAPGSMIRSV